MAIVFDGPPDLEVKENIFQKLWDTFNQLDRFTKFSAITMTLIGIAMIGSIGTYFTLYQHAASNAATIIIDPGRTIGYVNPLVFGQDVYYPTGDKTYYTNVATKTFDGQFLGFISQLSPTLFRCGGGTDSEYYRWTDGIGPVNSRPVTYFGQSKKLVLLHLEQMNVCSLQKNLGLEQQLRSMTTTIQ